MRHLARFLAIATLAVSPVVGGAALAQGVTDKVVHYPVNKTEENVALGGYDLVAYFKDKAAKKGSAEYAVRYGGTIYHFANKAHQDAFLANPTKYLPRFGGFCPVHLRQGNAEKGNPKEFVVHNGQLYICSSEAARASVEGNAEKIIQEAEANAPAVLRDRHQKVK